MSPCDGGGTTMTDMQPHSELWKEGERRGRDGGRVLNRVTLTHHVSLWQDLLSDQFSGFLVSSHLHARHHLRVSPNLSLKISFKIGFRGGSLLLVPV